MTIKISELHQQIVQEKQLRVLLTEEMERKSEVILNEIKALITKLRRFSLLDPFYQTIDETKVIQFIRSPVFTNNGTEPFESPSKLPLTGDLTRKISTFMKEIPMYLDLIALCIDRYFKTTHPNPPYSICSSSESFLASSTLPAMFGYGWCLEQGAAYSDFLCQLILIQLKSNGTSTSSGFRNSYVRTLVKAFLHLIGVQKYLQTSLASILFQFYYDSKLDSFDVNSNEYIERLIEYVDRFTSGLIRALPSAPPILRYFYSTLYQKIDELVQQNVADQKEPKEVVRFLFFDILLLPAFLSPKLFGLLDNLSINTNTKHIINMINIMKMAADPTRTPTRQFDINVNSNEKLHQLKTCQLIDKLCTFDGSNDAIWAQSIMKLIGVDYHPLLMSLPDIVFLTQIIFSTYNEISFDQKKRANIGVLCMFANSISNVPPYEFWYKSFKLPEQSLVCPLSSMALRIPMFTTDQIQVPDDEFTSFVKQLLFYLEQLQPIDNSPEDLMEFLNARKTIAIDNESPQWITRTDSIMAKVKAMKKSSTEIINRLDAIIKSRASEHAQEFQKSFMHQMLADKIKKQAMQVQNLSDQLSPIVDQCLVTSFLRKSHTEFKEDQLFMDQYAWVEFFTNLKTQFMTFLETEKVDTSRQLDLSRQLLSECMNRVRYKTFAKKYEADDKIVFKHYKGLMEFFMTDSYSPVLIKLFNTPKAFDSAIEVLHKGTRIGSPIERLSKIQMAIETLHDIYAFEAGEACAQDDFVPLFVFTLIKAKLHHLVSVTNYIQHFMMSLEESGCHIMDSKDNYVATTYITGAQHIIDIAMTLNNK